MPLLEDECDYEKQRLLRMAENKAMVENLFPKAARLSYASADSPKENRKPGVKRRRTESAISLPRRKLPKRKARSYVSKYESENDSEDGGDEEDPDDLYTPPNMIVKLWPWQHAGKDSQESELENWKGLHHSWKTGEDSVCLPKPKQRTRLQPKVEVEITEEDLILVAERVADKNYNKNGTTCHQCRQKTDDLKTVCRNQDCHGTRGQFCGPCLKNRYGEDAKKALMDKSWCCPPCRGICNCSFCMPKRGFKCTGILIHVAKERGYSDVKSFLGD